jgi:ATP-dependent DNA helicase RecQ
LVNKSSNKVFIILQVDKKIPLETIAKLKDLSMEKLYDEMETIVASGTKLNLDYAINQLVDEDDQIDILDYFKSCETSSLEVAKEELSDLDLEMDQLRIMRIKFLSTFGM